MWGTPPNRTLQVGDKMEENILHSLREDITGVIDTQLQDLKTTVQPYIKKYTTLRYMTHVPTVHNTCAYGTQHMCLRYMTHVPIHML